jgi:hypothetical protein
MRTLGIVIIGLLLIACGSDQSTPTAVDTIDVERTYNWKLVTTWPKKLPRFGYRTRDIRRPCHAHERRATAGRGVWRRATSASHGSV